MTKETKQVERSDGDVLLGAVKAWYVGKHYGFITPDDGGADLFCHESNLKVKEGTFQAVNYGTRVKITVQKKDEKWVTTECTAEDGGELPGFPNKKDALSCCIQRAYVTESKEGFSGLETLVKPTSDEDLAAISDLMHQRVKARDEKRFEESDALKEKMCEKGAQVFDDFNYWTSGDGRKWRINTDGSTKLLPLGDQVLEQDKIEIRLWMNKLCSGQIIGVGGATLQKIVEASKVSKVFFITRKRAFDMKSRILGDKLQECAVRGTVSAVSDCLKLMFVEIMALKAAQAQGTDNPPLFGSLTEELGEGQMVMGMNVPRSALAGVNDDVKAKLEAGSKASIWVGLNERICNLVFTGEPEQVKDAIAATILELPLETWLPSQIKKVTETTDGDGGPKKQATKNKKKPSKKKQAEKPKPDNKKKAEKPKPDNKEKKPKPGNKKKKKPFYEQQAQPKRRRYSYDREPPIIRIGFPVSQSSSPWQPSPDKHLASPVSRSSSPWQSFPDKHGRTYFRNLQTGEIHY